MYKTPVSKMNFKAVSKIKAIKAFDEGKMVKCERKNSYDVFFHKDLNSNLSEFDEVRGKWYEEI